MTTAFQPAATPEWDRVQRVALLTAAGGAVAFVLIAGVLYLVGALPMPVRQLFLSYLVGYCFWLSVALGCLVILMLQHLTGGAWGIVLRRVLESGTRTLAILALLFLPFFGGLFALYEWTDPAIVQHNATLQHKAIYLNVPFFIARAVGYFVLWLVLTYLLNRWSKEQDEGYPGESRRFRLLSAPGLVIYGFTVTFASIDWIMSLEPHWYSTIYPVLFATGQVLTGLAFAIAVLILLATQPPLDAVVSRRHLRDLGSLLLAFVMFWAYMSISQFLLIWIGNLPEEIPWYLRRVRGGWQVLAILLIVCHFALPFLLLLSRSIKENARRLALVAIFLLVMRFLDLFWWIEPAYPHPHEYGFWLLDIASVAAVGGLFVWWFVRQLRRRPLLPVCDPYLQEAIHHD